MALVQNAADNARRLLLRSQAPLQLWASNIFGTEQRDPCVVEGSLAFECVHVIQWDNIMAEPSELIWLKCANHHHKGNLD
jgi:hypothetical protein